MTPPQVATVVMYHLVQPPDAGPVAGLKSVDVAAFRGQVAYIRRHPEYADLAADDPALPE